MAGVTIVIGRIINSNLAEKIGTFQGALINSIVGLSFSFLFLFISSETFDISYATIQTVPLWAYFGGLVGVVVIVLSNYLTPKVSSFYLTLLIFIGQLFLGIIIDYFALSNLSIGKLIGGLFVLIGLAYNLWIDKKKKMDTII
jgi:transporter family-2 protein